MIKTVGVFFGGRSTEHDISIITALGSVIKPLELTHKFKVVPIYISKDGRWFSDEKLKEVSFFQNGLIDDFIKNNKPISITFDDGLIIRKDKLRRKDIKVDVAFPAMHGAYGEDGSLMGLLRMAGVPFVGSDMTASAISMDKVLSKQIAEINDIPVSKYVFFRLDEFETNSDAVIEDITSELEYPMFVKPVHLGSSIGITKVENMAELKNAVEVAFYYDNKILVEEAVNNLIEVTVPIMGNEVISTASVEKALFDGNKFFDFDTKYIKGNKKIESKGNSGSQGYSEIPAKLPGDLYEVSLDTAKKAYRAIGCEGIARVDLLIDAKTETVYFNEVNPLPGSLYAHNWRLSGVSSIELVTRLIELAEQRFEKNKKTETIFESSFLKKF